MKSEQKQGSGAVRLSCVSSLHRNSEFSTGLHIKLPKFFLNGAKEAKNLEIWRL